MIHVISHNFVQTYKVTRLIKFDSMLKFKTNGGVTKLESIHILHLNFGIHIKFCELLFIKIDETQIRLSELTNALLTLVGWILLLLV